MMRFKIIHFFLILCIIKLSGQNSGSSQIIDENYIQVTKKPDGTAYTDADTDGYIIRKSNNVFLKKILNRPLNIMDFGAVGDGITDDSEAMRKALNFVLKQRVSILEFSGNNTFNLKGNKFQLPPNLLIKFSGAILKNAEITGNNNTISANAVKIFDNITLSGSFINTDSIYVEWFGTFPNDSNSEDLKNTLEKLNKVFFSIKLNQGIYYTKLGNISLKGITGISANQTFIELKSDKNDLNLFQIGKIGGNISERTYDNNFLKSAALVLTAEKKKVFNNTLLIIGACHMASISDVKFIMNSKNTSLSYNELSKIAQDDSNSNLTNNAIVFDGASELINFYNIFTLSDVGFKFKKNTDFVSISNYTSWNGNNGLASVYFDETNVSNILFTGNQSWSQGLYGVYAKKGTQYTNFTNVKFENLRIEQLNENIKSDGKIIATSFWFGDYTYIPNLIFSNVMLAGTANGFRFGTLQDSKVVMSDILVHYDAKIPRKFALEANFKANGKSEFNLQNVSLAPDLKMQINNSNLQELMIKENKFKNVTITTQ